MTIQLSQPWKTPPPTRTPDEVCIDRGTLANGCDFALTEQDGIEDGVAIRIRSSIIYQVRAPVLHVYVFAYTFDRDDQHAAAVAQALDSELRAMTPCSGRDGADVCVCRATQ